VKYIFIVFALLVAGMQTSWADPVWLVVAASDNSPMAIARKGKSLSRLFSQGLIVRAADCGEKRDVLAYVVERPRSIETATAALARAREIVKDAYLKRCEVKPHSLLAFGISAVDPSIAELPDKTSNWEFQDALSALEPLPDGRAILILRHFVNEPDDPLQGRRERVLIADSEGRLSGLEDNCIRPGAVVVDGDRIAFDCVREQAADHFFHDSVVFDGAGKKILQVEHCRKPRWLGRDQIACDAESVGNEGRLTLQKKTTMIKLP
jgi:hypothetical protein